MTDAFDELKIRFLGSGDAFGSGGRMQACIHVESEGTKFLIDCGASSLIGMKRFGVDPASVDVILISHLHGDHFGGIPFLILDAQFNSPRTNPLVLAGPPGLEDRVRLAMEVFFPASTRALERVDVRFTELEPNVERRLGRLTVTPRTVVHACGAPPFALRIKVADRTIAYSGDTEWTEALVETARSADVFICEAYFFEKRVRYHLDFATLSRHLAELDCRRVVLTHMNTDMLERVADLDLEAAEDGKVLIL